MKIYFSCFFYFFTAVFLSRSKGLKRISKKIEDFYSSTIKNVLKKNEVMFLLIGLKPSTSLRKT